MIKIVLLSRPVEWLVRLAQRIRQLQFEVAGFSDADIERMLEAGEFSDAEAKSTHD